MSNPSLLDNLKHIGSWVEHGTIADGGRLLSAMDVFLKLMRIASTCDLHNDLKPAMAKTTDPLTKWLLQTPAQDPWRVPKIDGIQHPGELEDNLSKKTKGELRPRL